MKCFYFLKILIRNYETISFTDYRRKTTTKTEKEVIIMELALPVLSRLSFLRFLYSGLISLPNDVHNNLY